MSSETIALLAFRNTDGSLGFGQSKDPLTYGIRIERGESETRWVRAGAVLEFMALIPDRETAVATSSRLNARDAEGREVEMRRLALPSEVVETARALIWAHVWEDGGEAADPTDREKLSDAISDALGAGTPAEEAAIPNHWLTDEPECRWPQRLLIFDLDGTLADTSALDGSDGRAYRGRLDDIRPFGGGGALGMHDLARIASKDRRVVIATAASRGYAQDILAHLGIEVDEIHWGAASDKRAVFERAMEDASCGPGETLVIGDRWPDWCAATRLGIPSLGARDFGANLPGEAPDISFRTVEGILARDELAGLSYIGEAQDPDLAKWHAGSLLKAGPSSWALGRLFSRRTREELGISSPLTSAILAAKHRAPAGRLEAAIKVVLGQMARSDSFALTAVCSMPPKHGQYDRFQEPRLWAERILMNGRGVVGSLVDVAPERGGQTEKSLEERIESQEGRYRWQGEDLSGREVLLLDDVRTSGASLSAGAAALREAGAREVHSLTWAQTQAWYDELSDF